MKIEFHCNNCFQNFHIEDKYLIKKSAVNCPNCDTEFPKENLEELKQGVSFINKCRSEMKLEETNAGYTNLFNFTIID